LTKGTYAFAVTVDLPATTPAMNYFNVIIQDQANSVVDARYALLAQPLVNMGVEKPSLAWSRADPGQPTMVRIGITFTEDTQGLQALLIMLPDNFDHAVVIPIDVQNLNSRFPLTPGFDWVDYSQPDRIKIFLDDSEDVTTIPADTYTWMFPVMMPVNVPQVNLWFISLCDDRECAQPDDRSVKVSFPLAGFNINEISPEALRVTAAYARRSASTAALALSVCSLLALLPIRALPF
jgi:hypothetical protein